MLLAKRVKWCKEIVKMSWLSRMSSIYAPCSKGRMRIYYSLWSQRPMSKCFTLNGCHWDAGHQGCDCTFSLLQECFWWPGMANQMRQSIRACHMLPPIWGWFLQGPFMPYCGYCFPGSPACWFHKHWDHVGAKPVIWCSKTNFMKHVLAYVTTNQTAKTIAKFLYQGYIAIFGAPARLLSDKGARFTWVVWLRKLCKIFGIKQLSDHALPPPNLWVSREIAPDDYAHNWEAGRRQKSWLPIPFGWNSAHAYNATLICIVTGYSPHYLMFGQRPRLLVNFYFPTVGNSDAPTKKGLCQSMWTNI